MSDNVRDIDRIDDEPAPVEAVAEDQITEQPETEEEEPAQLEAEQANEPEPGKKTVPLEALHEERAKRKEEARRNQLLEERLTALADRLSQPPVPQKAVEVEPEPDPDDFGGQLMHKLTRLEKWQEEQRKQAESQQQEYGQRQQLNRLIETAQIQTKQFMEEAPDYGDAYQHYRTNRAAELETLGLQPGQINQQMNREELQFIARAQQQGQSAPEIIYKLAKARGYTGVKAELPNQQQAKKEPPRSVSAMSGKSTGGKLTAQKLLDMPEDEYFALLKKEPAKIKAIMNGQA